MRKQIAALTFALVVPAASFTPAHAAEATQTDANLGSLISRVADFVSSLFGFDDTTDESAEVIPPEVEYVSFDCPGAENLEPVEINGVFVATGPALCWAPADEVDDIIAAAKEEKVELTTADAANPADGEAISFKCPAVAPSTAPSTGSYISTENGVCWTPDEEEAVATEDAADVAAAAEAGTGDYIAVPCDGTPEVKEIDGKEVYTGTGLCFLSTEELADNA